MKKRRFRLDRLDPVLPLSPGRAERHSFEYYRHRTLSLYAALNVKTRAVHGMTAARHTSVEFITFFTGLVERAEHAREIHVVLDNLSAHKTKDVEQFLADYPQVRFHFTPTYSTWLNQVEPWFAKIQRDVIVRGVLTSVADLGNKLRKYLRAYPNRPNHSARLIPIPAAESSLTKSPGHLTSDADFPQPVYEVNLGADIDAMFPDAIDGRSLMDGRLRADCSSTGTSTPTMVPSLIFTSSRGRNTPLSFWSRWSWL
jgi:transposase